MFKIFAFTALILSNIALSMDAEVLRMNVYRRGETILGEEFIAATEPIVDYIATLDRPLGVMEVYRYTCSVKSRLIRPSFYHSNGTPGADSVNGWVEVRMVYELKDCVKVLSD